MKIKRALISVSDKASIVSLAKNLNRMGIEIISTGGTMKAIKEADIPVTYVSDVTGFPEIMDGRVKTLNPFIHGGILALRDNPAHTKAMEEHKIKPIDLVVVNLYPFRETIKNKDANLADAIENIDIGGPAMIRAAAKNFAHVAVIVNPERYDEVIEQLEKTGEISFDTRMKLAREAFSHTAEYDACIENYLAGELGEGEFPKSLHLIYEKIDSLRYGENPHQEAAFYREKFAAESGVANATKLGGKELSYNNIVDLDAAYSLASEFDRPAAAIIKHTNPCGTGIGDTISEAYEKAYQGDPVSAFGGIVALNREVDKKTADKISEIFIEAVIAPAFSQEAQEVLSQKKNMRILTAPLLNTSPGVMVKDISGGALVQSADALNLTRDQMKVVTKKQPTDAEWEQLLFAFKVVKHVKSNAIVVAKDNKTIGVGAGQMNRVGAAGIALSQAGDNSRGAVLASDAFFPFADTLELAAKAGITAVIQPGGSVNDTDSIKMADEYGIAMVFTGARHFRH
jgi:phosphoribosylaminoimidazolecarboxamide formyltransferase/IMP cyclohydrolase